MAAMREPVQCYLNASHLLAKKGELKGAESFDSKVGLQIRSLTYIRNVARRAFHLVPSPTAVERELLALNAYEELLGVSSVRE